MHYTAFTTHHKDVLSVDSPDTIELKRTDIKCYGSWHNSGCVIQSYSDHLLSAILNALSKRGVQAQPRHDYRLPKEVVSEVINELRQLVSSVEMDTEIRGRAEQALNDLIQHHIKFNYDEGHLVFQYGLPK